MESWAQLYELGGIMNKKSRDALVYAIKEAWVFQKDKEQYKAHQAETLDSVFTDVNKKVGSNLEQIES